MTVILLEFRKIMGLPGGERLRNVQPFWYNRTDRQADRR